MKVKFIFLVIFVLLGAVVFAQNPASDFEYQLNSQGNGVVINGYIGRSPTVVIPSSIEGYPVKEIYSLPAFTILSITIPDTVIKIPRFNGFDKLREIYLPDSVVLDGHDFENCYDLQTVRLPNNIKIIYQCTFENCKSLKTISLPTSLVAIDNRAFYRSGLESIKIPEGVTEIGASAFIDCEYLTEVYLPSTIRVIGSQAFLGCHNLVNIYIPESVTGRIGGFSTGNQFSQCSKLSLTSQALLRKLGYEGNF